VRTVVLDRYFSPAEPLALQLGADAGHAILNSHVAIAARKPIAGTGMTRFTDGRFTLFRLDGATSPTQAPAALSAPRVGR
jgi:hypothetical protein